MELFLDILLIVTSLLLDPAGACCTAVRAVVCPACSAAACSRACPDRRSQRRTRPAHGRHRPHLADRHPRHRTADQVQLTGFRSRDLAPRVDTDRMSVPTGTAATEPSATTSDCSAASRQITADDAGEPPENSSRGHREPGSPPELDRFPTAAMSAWSPRHPGHPATSTNKMLLANLAEDLHRERRRALHISAGERRRTVRSQPPTPTRRRRSRPGRGRGGARKTRWSRRSSPRTPPSTRRRTVFVVQSRITELMRRRGRADDATEMAAIDRQLWQQILTLWQTALIRLARLGSRTRSKPVCATTKPPCSR